MTPSSACRLVLAHTRAEPGEHVEVVVVAVFVVAGVEGKRHPQGDVTAGEMEPARHHADDHVRAAIEQKPAPQHTGVAPEPRLPEPVAQHDGAGSAVLAVGRGEDPSERGRDAEHGEDLGRHGGRGKTVGGALAHQVRLDRQIGPHAFEHGGGGLPVPIVGRRQLQLLILGRPLPQLHQLVGIGIGERPDEHEVGHREGGGVGPDAERDDQDRREREPGRAGERASGEAQVLPRQVPVHGGRVAEDAHGLAQPDQRAAGRAAGRVAALLEHGAHLAAVLGPERLGIEGEQRAVEPHHALAGAMP